MNALSLLRNIALIATMTTAIGVSAQSGLNNPITKAVMDVYEQQLAENPADYETRMARAREYYTHNEYMRALNDVDLALPHIPEADKQMLFDAYMLRANINSQTGRQDDALIDLDKAVNLFPEDYVALYQRANVLYGLGRYENARTDYKRLQRINPRSSEALLGLARIAVHEQNLGMANEYLDRAVNMDPANADLYVRRASVRRQMGNGRDAVEDLMLALSTDSGNERATRDLVDMSSTNYPEVIAGLTSAIAAAPHVAMFPYLRAVIAQAHFHYKDALEDFNRILDNNLSNHHGLYASIARCQLALGRYNEALFNVEHAVSMNPANAGYQVLRSQILRVLGRNEQAMDAAAQATALAPGKAVPLTEMAMCCAAKEQWNEAANLLGEAMFDDATSPSLILLRADILKNHCNSPVAADGFYEQVLMLDGYGDTDINSMRGFALLMLGREAEGRMWLDNIVATQPDNDGFVAFLTACFNSMSGNADAAVDAAALAMSRGYANLYDWTKNTDSPVNVEAIRNNPRFVALLKQHSLLFD